MFHDGDLQSGIALALQQSKAVLCFVQDDSDTSRQWEEVLKDSVISAVVTAQAVALRLQAGSQEASFLSPICPLNSVPAIVVIKNAQLQANLQSGEISVEELKGRLAAAFGVQDAGTHAAGDSGHDEPQQSGEQPLSEYLDLPPTGRGQMRLPDNAYDALRNHTQKLVDDGMSPSEIYQTQLRLLNNIPIFHEEVQRLRGQQRPEVSDYLRTRLLRLPAVGLRIPGQTVPAGQPTDSSSSAAAIPPSQQQQQRSTTPAALAPRIPSVRTNRISPAPQSSTSSPAPSQVETDKQKTQRAEYIRMQREREQKQRDERERIKAQIKADREERRRLDQMRKRGGNLEQTGSSSSTTPASSSAPTTSKPRFTEVRVQVRTFDGSTLRSTFQPSSTLSADVRPWIDSTANTTVPYDLKLILTPLPNRNIEAGEEEMALSDLGIVGSCTLVMVPVKGYVESYTGSMPGGLLGAAVSGGYSLVSGTAGMVLGGVKSLLGYNNTTAAAAAAAGQDHTSTAGTASRDDSASGSSAMRNARVRTLADQRAENAGREQQFYNGNQLNFEPKKDDTDKRD
ncbi:hypothetical protein A1O1_02170 [Capronia coronata CBS 617.96]|uniref:UBX domain-containing protein n=1 Tax=Capronia coronata CBS 617.96 TaxID=1182541 RepID=W9YLK2_9EURO|nr:uncharacterized protein A1O1_02170 [Capronia coronata CBS 617.96]EXJ93777.1 hypothetical protein A1O1_02170 [Capronia coronata CBS 617.96]